MRINNLYIIPEFNNIESSLNLCKKYDLKFEYNDFFSPSLLDDSVELNKRISLYKNLDRDLTNDNLHGVFYDICINSCDKKIKDISIDRMYKSMEIASILSCNKVIFHTNIIPGFEPQFYLDSWLNAYSDFYRKLCLEYKDITICVENMFDFNPDMLNKLACSLSDVSNFGVCFDIAHANIHDDDPCSWINILDSKIKHLHINDNLGDFDSHSVLGEGNINWSKYFSLIYDYLSDIDILIEVNGYDKILKSINYLMENNYFEAI